MGDVERLLTAPPVVPAELNADAPVPPNSGAGNGGGETDHPELPVIYERDGEQPRAVDELEEHLANAGGIYVHSGRLVRVHHAESRSAKRGIHRADGGPVIQGFDSTSLGDYAGRKVRFLRWDGRAGDWRRKDCSKRLSEALLSRGAWVFPSLAGIIEAPAVTDENEVIDELGFHERTGLYLAGTVPSDYRRPAESPSEEDIQWAREVLLDILGTFPFVSEADRSAGIAALLTALLRRLFPAAPFAVITAPTPGTGKSLLCDIISIIVLGRRGTALSLGDDDAETAKRIVGVLLAGDALIIIDNISRPFFGDLFCQIGTQLTIRARPLGVSTMLTIPTSAAVLANGNNVQVIGDLRRRVMLIRLDAGVERPETIRHDGDILSEVAERRGEIITAALTIVRGYLAAGSPEVNASPLGGFTHWDRMVRRPLMWAGLPDPLKASQSLRESDPDLEATRALFATWRTIYGDRYVTAAEVAADATRVTPRFDGAGPSPDAPDLSAALQVITAEKITARRIGNWLRRHRDRLVDGLRLERGPDDPSTKVATWRVVPV